ncbi:MAG: DUF996 domain-containing protein, partial [Candidatus Bathyarchaeia archaeon]
MDFKLIKNLGGIGAVLLTIGIFFPILSLVGIVFVLLSLKGIGEYYNERCIFNYALYYVILSVIGIAVYAVLPIVLLKENPLVFMFMIIQCISCIFAEEFLFRTILILVVLFIIFFFGAVFLMKSFNLLSARSRKKMFR